MKMRATYSIFGSSGLMWSLALVLCFGVTALPWEAIAQTCTTGFQASEREGILTQVIEYIKTVLNTASARLYNGIIGHQSFISAINVAFTLFITLFGVMFLYGIVPLTLGQAATRLFKLSIIWALIAPGGGWQFFSEYAVRFFNDGTDELIAEVIRIAVGDASGGIGINVITGSPQPFRIFDQVAGDVLSPKMMTSVIGMLTTGPQGMAMGGLLGMSLGSFVIAIVKALRVYCLSLVAKALLFGLAPIFVSFMLFERTKHMFTGWVNQLVNYSLQPLLMFTFLSFFVVLMQTAVANIMNNELCFVTVDSLSGTPFQTNMWRFVDENGNPSSSDWDFDGAIQCKLQGGSQCREFPVDIVDILTFLILAHLAYRFTDVVLLIATEISSSTLFLDRLQGGLNSVFGGQGRSTPRSPQRAARTTQGAGTKTVQRGNAAASATPPPSGPSGVP